MCECVAVVCVSECAGELSGRVGDGLCYLGVALAFSVVEVGDEGHGVVRVREAGGLRLTHTLANPYTVCVDYEA